MVLARTARPGLSGSEVGRLLELLSLDDPLPSGAERNRLPRTCRSTDRCAAGSCHRSPAGGRAGRAPDGRTTDRRRGPGGHRAADARRVTCSAMSRRSGPSCAQGGPTCSNRRLRLLGRSSLTSAGSRAPAAQRSCRMRARVRSTIRNQRSRGSSSSPKPASSRWNSSMRGVARRLCSSIMSRMSCAWIE